MRMTLDVVVVGALMNKDYDEAYALVENMAHNHH